MISLEDIIASDPRFANVDINKVRDYYNEVNRSRNAKTLPELIVTKTKGELKNKKKEIQQQQINSYYTNKFFENKTLETIITDYLNNNITLEDAKQEYDNKINYLVEHPQIGKDDIKYKAKIAGIDKQVRNTAFSDDKTLNLILNGLSPSQLFGATIDAIQGEKGFIDGLRDGNSGFATDNLMRNNPELANIINFVGDITSLYNINKGINKIINTKNLDKLKFYRDVYSPRLTSQIRRNLNQYDVGKKLNLNKILTQEQYDVVLSTLKDSKNRLINSLSDEGYYLNPKEKQLINNPLKDIIFFVDETTKDNVLGNSYGNKIGLQLNKINNNNIPLDEIITHEIEHSQRKLLKNEINSNRLKTRGNIKQKSKDVRHQLQESGIYTNKESELLDDAYTFTEDYLNNNNNISPILEKGATNRQLRSRIIKRTNLTGEELDNYIDNLSDIDIIEMLNDKTINAYSYDFYKQFIENNKPKNKYIPNDVVKRKANAIRKSLKYVAKNNIKSINKLNNYV